MSQVIMLDANGKPMTAEMMLGQARICDEKAERYGQQGMFRLRSRMQKTARQWRELAMRVAMQTTENQDGV